MTAVIAYGRSPSFTRYAPGQPTTFNDILRVLDLTVFTDLRETGLVDAATADGSTGVIIGRV